MSETKGSESSTKAATSDSTKSYNLGAIFGSAAIPFLIAWLLFIIIIVLRLKKKKIYDKIADKTYGVEQEV